MCSLTFSIIILVSDDLVTKKHGNVNISETLQNRHIIAIIHRYELVYSLLFGTMTFDLG